MNLEILLPVTYNTLTVQTQIPLLNTIPLKEPLLRVMILLRSLVENEFRLVEQSVHGERVGYFLVLATAVF